ncbi:prepilin-type N-terminal cleavage/methylation domain-containing protein [Microvirga sp. 0TCS3.31]
MQRRAFRLSGPPVMSSSTLRRCCNASRRRTQDGYTLLEFLVAFTVLSLFLTAGLAAVAVALRGDQQAAFVTRATPLARAKLAAAGIDFPLRAGVVTGSFGNGYLWQAEVRNYRSAPLNKTASVHAYWVEVTVAEPSGTSGRALSLATIALNRETRR